jgi:hypothetical protein
MAAAAQEKKTCSTATAHGPAPEEEGGHLASSSAGELDAVVGELALCSPPAAPPAHLPPHLRQRRKEGAPAPPPPRATTRRTRGSGRSKGGAWGAEQRGDRRGGRSRGACEGRGGVEVGVARRQGGATVAALCGGGPSEPE